MQKQATDSLFKGLDRFGLAPILLLAGAYVVQTSVIQPIAKSYSAMVDKVGDTNALLREAVERNNAEDAQRVAAISAAQALNQSLAQENRALNEKILGATADAAAERRKIHDETRVVLERVERLLSKGTE
jgi:hypothetical protein